MRTALGTGSGLAFASVSLLAVYREAFETVLFYKASVALQRESGGRALRFSGSSRGPCAGGGGRSDVRYGRGSYRPPLALGGGVPDNPLGFDVLA